MAKVLVLGANGMAGHVIYLMLREKKHEVTGATRKQGVLGNDILCDVMDQECVKSIIQTGGYDYIINCAGTLNRNVDMDMYHGIYINSVLPHYLALLCKDSPTRLIHISSDCVFRGNQNGFYTESSEKNAISIYGISKSLGEVRGQNLFTLRTSLVGPEIRNGGIGLFNWFMKNDEVDGFAKVYWTGVTTVELARTISSLIDSDTATGGLYHIVNNEKISKYELLCLFNERFRNGSVRIYSSDTIESDKSLYNTSTADWINIPSYRQMIEEMHDWMLDHASLYQKYLRREQT
ncbi:MAG TPA: NAD(P)-dependent oxidoreductase [Lachnospiraceae bacterium]|nr:NAD(P)-dependent oxidoreductase [Lachnospiraceae bacterium]